MEFKRKMKGDSSTKIYTEEGRKNHDRIFVNGNRDYCPKSTDMKHSFSDYKYWGSDHPKCDFCGFEDKTRKIDG